MDKSFYHDALAPLVEAFQLLGIAYHLVGSLASVSHGVARSTLDADIVADLRFNHIDALVDRLKSDYYIDADMIHDAVRDRSSFNVIHLPTMFKVDVFILKATDYDRQTFLRADLAALDNEADSPLFFVESAEDVVLNKLRWYRLGGEVSERQWNDVLGVLRVQSDALDMNYLHQWAATLGVFDLLDSALKGQ
jgi:hypothetical protein